MSSNVRRRRRTVEERLGAAVRHLRPGDLAGRGEPLPRDRGATRVSSGGQGEGGDRGSHIEHVTLLATTSQTVASGGASLGFDRIEGPPTERRGFETLSARLAASGEVFAIPADVTGRRIMSFDIHFNLDPDVDDPASGTIEIRRTRKGVTTTLASASGAGYRIDGVPHLDIRNGDTTEIVLDLAASVDVSWGRVQITDFEESNPTSRVTTYREVVLEDGPVAYWRFEETSGTTAADETGNGNDGTHVGDVTPGVAGQIQEGGSGASYSGSMDWTSVGDVAALEFSGTAPFTLEAWVIRDDVTAVQDRAILSKLSDGDVDPAKWELSSIADGSAIRFYVARDDSVAEDAAQSGYVYAAGTSYHVVGTYDGATLRLYVNAALIASTASTRTLPDTTGAVRIGAREGPGVSGDLDEVAIYDRALTATEIDEHYRVGIHGGA